MLTSPKSAFSLTFWPRIVKRSSLSHSALLMQVRWKCAKYSARYCVNNVSVCTHGRTGQNNYTSGRRRKNIISWSGASQIWWGPKRHHSLQPNSLKEVHSFTQVSYYQIIIIIIINLKCKFTVQRKLNIRKRKRKQIGLQCGLKC